MGDGEASKNERVWAGGCNDCCHVESRLVASPNGRFLRHRSQTKQIGMNFKRLYQHQRSLPKSEGDHGFAAEGSPPKQSTFTTGRFSNIDSRDLA